MEPPFDTEAVTGAYESWQERLPYFPRKREENFPTGWRRRILYSALGKNVRGINKRGWIYESKCSDDPNHRRTSALYGAHNFLIVDGKECFGVFLIIRVSLP